MTTPTDVVTARDSLEWYDQKQIAVARGDAVAIRNGKTIKADVSDRLYGQAAPAQAKAGAQAGRLARRRRNPRSRRPQPPGGTTAAARPKRIRKSAGSMRKAMS